MPDYSVESAAGTRLAPHELSRAPKIKFREGPGAPQMQREVLAVSDTTCESCGRDDGDRDAAVLVNPPHGERLHRKGRRNGVREGKHATAFASEPEGAIDVPVGAAGLELTEAVDFLVGRLLIERN